MVIFIVYDFGGGTLDVAVAQSNGGNVDLLAHGGIQHCGGRDFDRKIFDAIVEPWLFENFDLPDDIKSENSGYLKLYKRSVWAVENAKIELSSVNDEVRISLSESDVSLTDEEGEEIFLDVPMDRKILNPLLENQIQDSVDVVNKTLGKAGLKAESIDSLVFVGGPPMYKPLRDKISAELGIPPASSDINPMTAVSEGAALFAESIDWDSENLGRKSNRGKVSSAGKSDVTFKYESRTPKENAKIAIQFDGEDSEKAEYQIDCMTTGWSSGRIELSKAKRTEIPLTKMGENQFKVFVFDGSGNPIKLESDKIIITRTTASIEAIPASHSIGIEVLDKIGGKRTLVPIIKSGDNLPDEGSHTFKSTESLKAGSKNSIRFNLWEGEIKEPVTDNRWIGCLKILGTDFDEGVITAGADLECNYKVSDSSLVTLQVSVPSIEGKFLEKNFYSREENQSAISKNRLVEEVRELDKRTCSVQPFN